MEKMGIGPHHPPNWTLPLASCFLALALALALLVVGNGNRQLQLASIGF
jgi:hypothetical protein